MKVFRSLNCSHCNLPLIPNNDDPRSPRQLFCGVVLCSECFLKEKSLDKSKRSHQCTFTNCLSNQLILPPYFLNELLINESLELSAENQGYILVKSLQLPECPICQEEYSIDTESFQPFRLRCNHLICNTCFEMIRSQESSDLFKFKVRCPICQSVCLRSKDCVRKNNVLKTFLRELPEMLKQMEELEKEGKPNESKDRCENCKKNFLFSQMFSCFDCDEKICGACAFRKHRPHAVVDLIVKEIDQIIDETGKSVSTQISCYKGIFPPLHQDLLDNISMFEKSLLSKVLNITKENIERARKESFDCCKLGDAFELISEKYLPTLREINSKLLDLLNDTNLGFVQVSIFHDSTDPKIEEKRIIEEMEEESEESEETLTDPLPALQAPPRASWLKANKKVSLYSSMRQYS